MRAFLKLQHRFLLPTLVFVQGSIIVIVRKTLRLESPSNTESVEVLQSCNTPLACDTRTKMLFEDSFLITAINPEGKKFDRVNRLHATGESFEMQLVLDYNSEIYSLLTGDTIHLLLSSSLALDASSESSFTDGIPDDNVPSLMDKYEYVMHGKVFKIAHPPSKGTNM